MIQLVIAVLAIALCALAVAGGINYLDLGVGARTAAREQASVGFAVLDAGFSAYRISNGTAPSAADWEGELYPHYAQKPETPDGMSWSYGSDASGWWFCLSGQANEATYQGLRKYADAHAAETAISGTCGDPGDAVNVDSFPVSLAVTHYSARK
jgi:hypothetical protein